MNEPLWKQVDSTSGYYSVQWLRDPSRGMEALRQLFPECRCDAMNLILLGTSGVHGSYTTLDDLQAQLESRRWIDPRPVPVDETEDLPEITFVVVKPRTVMLYYGNVRVEHLGDIAWLRDLASTTPGAVAAILAGSVR